MKKIIYFFLSLVFIASSCQTKNENDSEDTKEFDNKTEAISTEIKSTVPTLPAPDEFAAKLQATGADYMLTIINSPENAAAYMEGTNEKKAVTLGIYMANLAYTTAYNESADSKKLIDAIIELSSSLGIERSIMSGIAERYANTEEASDVESYVNEMSSKAHETLRTSGRHRLAAIAYAGFYIEGLHMALGIIRNYPNDLGDDLRQQLMVPLYHAILSQNKNVEAIKTYLGENIEGVENTPYFNDLNKMQKIYSEIDYKKILDSQDLNYIETDSTISSLAKTITEMRARLVE